MLRLPVAALAVLAITGSRAAAAVVTIPPAEDVMTSAFFGPPSFVRGYLGEGRTVHRVSSDNAFNVGPETVYVTFDPAAFSAFTSPVFSAVLTATSTDGQFFANAGPGNPFIVSAHGVDSDPLASITDDTNPSGPIDWFAFFNNNILPADPAAITSVDAFGTVEFDVTALVNDWLDGTTPDFAIALTGKNDPQTASFLHGFLNNTETPGSTFLRVDPIPEPTSLMLILALAGSVSLWLVRPAREAAAA